MTGASELTTQPAVHGNLAISRKIHKQLVNKRNRWKPSELELAVLKLHFQKNKYPFKEDKEDIIKSLEENFQTKIDINQLSRWFQHEREKFQRHIDKRSKNTYVKFRKEDLEFLQERFKESNYPKIEDMKVMAQRLEVSLSKIENWYKHNRRSLAKRGHFQLKTKKYFRRDELKYLMEMFDLHPRPNKDQILEMAERLDCNEIQIKNWYSNKRKKFKSLAKKKGVSFGEEVLHKTDFPSFPKGAGFADLDFGIGNGNNFGINSELPSLPNTILPTPSQFPEFKGMLPFMPNLTLPTFQNSLMYNGFANNAIPLLIIPTTTMNTSSPMIVNGSVINTNVGGSSVFGSLPEIQSELKSSKNSSDPVKKIKTQSPPLGSSASFNTYNYSNPLTNNAFVPLSAFNSHAMIGQSGGNSWLSNNQPNLNLAGGGGGAEVGVGIQAQSQPQNMPNMAPQQQLIYNNSVHPQASKENFSGFQNNLSNLIPPLPMSHSLNPMGSIPTISSLYPAQGIDVNAGNGGQARVQYVSSVYLPPGTSNNIFLNPYPNTYQQNPQNLILGGQSNYQFNMSNQAAHNMIIHPPSDFENREMSMNQVNFDGLKSCN